MRNALRDLAPIMPATTYHRRSYAERYSRFISPTLFPQILEAVIDTTYDNECEDDESLSSGVPDLLLWTKVPLPPFWFFAEVKAPGDRIRDSQFRWIRANWGKIEGRVLVISIFTAD